MPQLDFEYITVQLVQETLVLTLTEPRLSSATVAVALTQELHAAIDQRDSPRIVLDLQNVKTIYSVALQSLMSVRRKIAERSGRLVLCGLTPQVAEIMQITGLIAPLESSAPLFETESDVRAAIARLDGALL